MHFVFLSTFHVSPGDLLYTEELSLNSNVIMLVTSCINFHENILYIGVFIPILKVAG